MQPNTVTIESNAGLKLTYSGKFNAEVVEHVMTLFEILIEDHKTFMRKEEPYND